MDHITIPISLTGQFVHAVGSVEVHDEQGRSLGLFIPKAAKFPGEPDDTLEELEAALAEPGGSTLEEIWRELGAK